MADPFHQFQIYPIQEIQIGHLDLSYTNSSLWMTLAVIASITLLSLATRRKALVPDRMQVLAEMTYEFIASMIRDNIGAQGRQYFGLIFTLFMIVLMGNVLGMLPFSFTFTSHLIVTGALALLVFFAVTIIGIWRHGFKFFSLFVPPNVSPFILPLIVPIEIISFLVRPVTLSVRLFANMMAGHLVLKVFAGFSAAMLGLGAGGYLLGLVPMLFNSILIAFEFLIAFLQAYVFTILSCIYLKDTVDIHH